MMPVLLGLLTSMAAGADPAPPSVAKTGVLPLFASEEWYQKAGAEEKAYEGLVEVNPPTGRIGKPGRFNTYRLAWNNPDGTRTIREIYAPGKAHLLTGFLGKRVRLVGKAVETKAEDGVHAEVWPARVEPVGLVSPDAQHGILARCGWQPAAAKRRGTSHWVITNGTDLARGFGYFGPGVDRRASQDVATDLKVAALDWKKQMLICVAAGLHVNGERVRITEVSLKDKVMTVKYRLEVPAAAAAGLAYPTETVLVDRFDGEVKFEEQGK